jgi:predicted unusual protein kinase regulating ubiquinone biosynthesis (AarF/ABC1/UbiB family)
MRGSGTLAAADMMGMGHSFTWRAPSVKGSAPGRDILLGMTSSPPPRGRASDAPPAPKTPPRAGRVEPVEHGEHGERGERVERVQSARPEAPPVSRLGRLARLGALAPRALPIAAEAVRRAVGGRRTAEQELEARRKVLQSAKKTAEAMLKTLGEMKGLPLKFGQMASYIDGLAPPGYEDKFQRVLSRLQQKAPPLSPEAAVKVIRKELGADPRDLFAEWETEPFAAASIGQVHRAVTRAGERVAVKVQYPGIDKAIENDLKSLSMLETMISPIGRRYQTKETLEEVKSVFLAEIDYALEAETADEFRRMHADDRDVVVPRVVHSLSTKRVLTLELVGGVDYATFAERAPQADRNAAGETLARFMFRSLWKHGVLYADPHPGNYRFLGGGRVAFLDFGCHKRLAPPLVEGMKRYIIALQNGDMPAFYAACVEVLGYDPNDVDSFALYTEYTKLVLQPFVVDGPFTFTKDFARESVAFLVRGGKKLVFKGTDAMPKLPAPVRMPSDMTFVNRLQWGFTSVLAGLHAEADWRRLVEPWLHGPLVPLPSALGAPPAIRSDG